LRDPIAGISQMMKEIGRGRWRPAAVHADIRELDDMSRQTLELGTRLATSEVQRGDTQRRLELVLESATESLWEYDMVNQSLRVRGNLVARFGLPAAQLSDSEAKYRFADALGEYHWLLSRGRVLEHDPDTGAPRVLAGTHVDIDALKRVEDELRAATVQAQAASEAKGRLLSGISHELRTPLNAILGFAQLMRMDCDDESQAEAAEYLDEILLASRHLNQLLGEILEWSSLQQEAPQLELQAVDVCGLMRECAELVSLEVQQRGLQLELSLPDEDLQVLAEPRRLRQVVLNLLSNAMKYNIPEGRIALRAETTPTLVRLLVEDTGLGIDPAQQGQVFEPFQRLGRENSMIQGTGIGLSLCLEFARLMNGQMGLHSEPGVGSRFWIELPRLVPHPAR
jgi:signal transduction histidine kinase